MICFELWHRDKDDNSLFSTTNINLLRRRYLKMTKFSLEVGNTALQIDQSLGDNDFGLIRSAAGRIGRSVDLAEDCSHDYEGCVLGKQVSDLHPKGQLCIQPSRYPFNAFQTQIGTRMLAGCWLGVQKSRTWLEGSATMELSLRLNV